MAKLKLRKDVTLLWEQGTWLYWSCVKMSRY